MSIFFNGEEPKEEVSLDVYIHEKERLNFSNYACIFIVDAYWFFFKYSSPFLVD